MDWDMKTQEMVVANIRSILQPFVGMDSSTGQPTTDPNRANRVQATPHDLALLIVQGLQKRGFAVRLKRPQAVKRATKGRLYADGDRDKWSCPNPHKKERIK